MSLVTPRIPDTEEFPIAGDFDGDGATDIGVYRRNNVMDDSNYFILGSTSGFQSFEWGNQEDMYRRTVGMFSSRTVAKSFSTLDSDTLPDLK